MMRTLSQVLRDYAEADGRGYPDWVMRYGPVAARLNEQGWLAGRRVVEIGANQNGLARFAKVPVIAVDLAWDQLMAFRDTQGGRAIAGDVCALPLRPNSVDLCVCMDTFEHIPGRLRVQAAQEIAAALSPRGVAVVGFPCGEPAARAEAEVRDAYYLYTRNELRWLEEHKECGLPDAQEIAGALSERLADTHRVTIRPNSNVQVWKLTWRILMCGWPGRGNSVAQVALRWSAPLLARAHFGTCYRTMIWVEPREP
jgi:hypothetical protein